MQTEILKIPAMCNPDTAGQVMLTLKTAPGVIDVTTSQEDSTATIQFDRDVITFRALRATLLNAGYSSIALNPTLSTEGSCCGGCGG